MPNVPSTAELLAQMNMFFSKFTGEEVEKGIEEAINAMSFIHTNVITPAVHLTGDVLLIPIVALTNDMYLESISLNVLKGFSKSVGLINYNIVTYTENLLTIPTDFMRETGQKMTYYIEREFPVDTAFFVECDSRRAFGDITVKLNFR